MNALGSRLSDIRGFEKVAALRGAYPEETKEVVRVIYASASCRVVLSGGPLEAEAILA